MVEEEDTASPIARHKVTAGGLLHELAFQPMQMNFPLPKKGGEPVHRRVTHLVSQSVRKFRPQYNVDDKC